MNDFKEWLGYFSEMEDCAEAVRRAERKVYIYGMGNGAEKVLKWCKYHGIKVDGLFASDDFVRGQTFCGYTVEPLSQAEAKHGKLTVLLGFGTELSDIMDRINKISERHELFAPDVSVADDSFFDKSKFTEMFDDACKAYSLLSDDHSRHVFVGLTSYKISGRLKYLRDIFTDEEKPSALLKLGSDEIYLDMGAYNGDTVLSFVNAVNNSYTKIIAVEPEKRNFQKCVKNCTDIDRIELINAACWSHDTTLAFGGGQGRQARLETSGNTRICSRSVDSILNGGKCTYIKYDVEGADIPALAGSRQTVQKYAPKLCCAVYHRPYDYIRIPLAVADIRSDYTFALRQQPYYPAWETELLCVVKTKAH